MGDGFEKDGGSDTEKVAGASKVAEVSEFQGKFRKAISRLFKRGKGIIVSLEEGSECLPVQFDSETIDFQSDTSIYVCCKRAEGRNKDGDLFISISFVSNNWSVYTGDIEIEEMFPRPLTRYLVAMSSNLFDCDAETGDIGEKIVSTFLASHLVVDLSRVSGTNNVRVTIGVLKDPVPGKVGGNRVYTLRKDLPVEFFKGLVSFTK